MVLTTKIYDSEIVPRYCCEYNNMAIIRRTMQNGPNIERGRI